MAGVERKYYPPKKVIDPLEEHAVKTNTRECNGSTKTVERIGGNKRGIIVLSSLVGLTTVGGGAALYVNNVPPAFHEQVDSKFLEHLRGEKLVDNSIFDNTKQEGVINQTNAIQMTYEEYQKIAPPTIEKDWINIPITIVSQDGQIRELKFKRSADMIGGERRIGGEEKIFTKNRITFSGLKKGDIFKSSVNGKIYHAATIEKPDGTALSGVQFTIEDGSIETGDSIVLYIFVSGAIKQLMETPRYEDYTGYLGKKEIRYPDGKTIMADTYGQVREMPEVRQKIGDRLFENLTADQITIDASTGVWENGIYRGGGAGINIVTLDKKATALK